MKNDKVHLFESQRGQKAGGGGGEGFVIYGICRYVRLSVIWCRNQIREIGPRIGYHFPGN